MNRIVAMTEVLKLHREAEAELRERESTTPKLSLSELREMRATAEEKGLPKNVAFVDHMIAEHLGGLSVAD